MSNIINSQKVDIYNKIPSISMGKFQKNSFVQAAQYLPGYSIGAAIKEKDEFRKQITEYQNQTFLKPQKKSPKGKIILTAAVAAGMYLLTNAIFKKK